MCSERARRAPVLSPFFCDRRRLLFSRLYYKPLPAKRQAISSISEGSFSGLLFSWRHLLYKHKRGKSRHHSLYLIFSVRNRDFRLFARKPLAPARASCGGSTRRTRLATGSTVALQLTAHRAVEQNCNAPPSTLRKKRYPHQRKMRGKPSFFLWRTCRCQIRTRFLSQRCKQD